ncbi:hypothetical protein HPB47_016418 [Ixodes persulcatus]|uniref:Uncharacterized protein n=1 Tax=Ixodes persulcatus TaxID=34615 RepID=A0AC60QTE2_IXOPE|nr:hypothetical protein HPB47_016418 [Ixodes persulcatus]
MRLAAALDEFPSCSESENDELLTIAAITGDRGGGKERAKVTNFVENAVRCFDDTKYSPGKISKCNADGCPYPTESADDEKKGKEEKKEGDGNDEKKEKEPNEEEGKGKEKEEGGGGEDDQKEEEED